MKNEWNGKYENRVNCGNLFVCIFLWMIPVLTVSKSFLVLL